MKQVIYFETSALAKWYLPEEQSSEVEKYIQEHGPVVISELTLVEMRDLLAKLRREGSLDSNAEIKVFATFEEDIRQKFLICHPLSDGVARGAFRSASPDGRCHAPGNGEGNPDRHFCYGRWDHGDCR
jgi:predicted nucleic acid-binding protein